MSLIDTPYIYKRANQVLHIRIIQQVIQIFTKI